MANNNWFQIIPVWGIFALQIILVVGAIWMGQLIGTRVRRKGGEIQDAPIGSVVGSALGLLAFMLAFTFQIVASRYDTRKELLLDEVTTIRTTYLRAALLPEPHRSDCKKILREYTDLRVELANDVAALQKVITRSEELQRELWSHAEALAGENRSSEIYALFTSSINELIDLYNKRVTVSLQYRIPPAILWILYFITFFSMMVLGYQFGISGKSNFTVSILFALIFSAVMWLIFALDRPETGIIRLNQQPFFTLQKQLQHNP